MVDEINKTWRTVRYKQVWLSLNTSSKEKSFKSLQSFFVKKNQQQHTKMPAALLALYLHATIHATHQRYCSANHWAHSIPFSPGPIGAIAEVPQFKKTPSWSHSISQRMSIDSVKEVIQISNQWFLWMMGINFDQPVSLVYQPAILYGDVFIDSGYLWLIRLHISYTPGGSSRLTAICDATNSGRKQLWFVGSFGVSTMACSRRCHADSHW